jgi:hypothetical protein
VTKRRVVGAGRVPFGLLQVTHLDSFFFLFSYSSITPRQGTFPQYLREKTLDIHKSFRKIQFF